MNTESEAKAILNLCDGNLKAALEMAERHLNTIYTRAQVLLSLAGMVVTVTGFSGRLIAGSSKLAQSFLTQQMTWATAILRAKDFVKLRIAAKASLQHRLRHIH